MSLFSEFHLHIISWQRPGRYGKNLHPRDKPRGFTLFYKKRKRAGKFNLSEIITILICYHFSGFDCFKNYYLNLKVNNTDFDQMPHYNRFIAIIKQSLVILYHLCKVLKGRITNLYFIDSTKLPVFNNLRINRHKVFNELYKRGKTKAGWFFGFKLYVIINDFGEIMEITLTKGNVDDRSVVEILAGNLTGILIGDRGYIEIERI